MRSNKVSLVSQYTIGRVESESTSVSQTQPVGAVATNDDNPDVASADFQLESATAPPAVAVADSEHQSAFAADGDTWSATSPVVGSDGEEHPGVVRIVQSAPHSDAVPVAATGNLNDDAVSSGHQLLVEQAGANVNVPPADSLSNPAGRKRVNIIGTKLVGTRPVVPGSIPIFDRPIIINSGYRSDPWSVAQSTRNASQKTDRYRGRKYQHVRNFFRRLPSTATQQTEPIQMAEMPRIDGKLSEEEDNTESPPTVPDPPAATATISAVRSDNEESTEPALITQSDPPVFLYWLANLPPPPPPPTPPVDDNGESSQTWPVSSREGHSAELDDAATEEPTALIESDPPEFLHWFANFQPPVGTDPPASAEQQPTTTTTTSTVASNEARSAELSTEDDDSTVTAVSYPTPTPKYNPLLCYIYLQFADGPYRSKRDVNACVHINWYAQQKTTTN